MMVQVFLLIGCTSPDKLIGDSNVFLDDTDVQTEIDTADTASSGPTETGVPDTDSSSVNGVLSGGADVGDEVELTGLVVTSPSNDDGFYAGDPEGGSSSGIWIQAGFSNKGIFDVEVGQQIDIVGTYAEPTDDASTQEGLDDSESMIVINEPTGLTVNEMAPLIVVEATEITTEEMLNSEIAESYEGTLVKIAGPQLIVSNNTLYLNGTLPVGDKFIPIDPGGVDESLQLEWAYGIIGYQEGRYWLFPRTEADAVQAMNNLVDMTADQLFISEVFRASTPPPNCEPSLNWYLELTYLPSNDQNLVAETMYLIRQPASGSWQVSKIVPDSGAITKYDVGIIGDQGSTTCLSRYDNSGSALQYQTEIAGPLIDPITTLEPGDLLKLVHAANYDDLTSGAYTSTIIDSLLIGNDFQSDISKELNPSFTGNGADDTDGSEWCSSTYNLLNGSGEQLINQASFYFGSPGGYDIHCY